MVDNARIAIGSRGLAIRAGSRRTSWRGSEDLTFSRCFRTRESSLRAAEILSRIDRCRSFSDLEVQLRRRHIACLARVRNHLPTLDGIASLDHDFARVSVG